MAKKNSTAKTTNATIENAPEIELNAEATSEAEATAETAETTEDVVDQSPEKVKRERNYSQSAIDTADLERLNQLKTFIKEKLNFNVSNQRIITAALDCLGENVEAFLKNIADEANNKQLAKERKAYEALKLKFEAMEAPAAEATEAPAAE